MRPTSSLQQGGILRNDLTLDGHRYRLRPVSEDDADAILELRNSPEARRFLGDTVENTAAQKAWIRRYYGEVGDWYFMVEPLAGGPVEGTLGIYHHDPSIRQAEWGRWVIRPDSLAAVESAWLCYRMGFERIGLDRLYCRSLALNAKVLSFHDSMGATRVGFLPSAVRIAGQQRDLVEHAVKRDEWGALAPRLEALSRRLAERGQADAQ